METLGTNLFIVDDDKVMVVALKNYLQNRFGKSVRISTFNDGESCLGKIDKETNIVILDYFLGGKNGLDILKSIKTINPKTEVIMLSGNEDMALAVETFRAGAKDYVVKGRHSWQRVHQTVNYIITEPIRIMVNEFSISKQLAMFLLAFVTVGIAVFCIMRFF
jgi:two-component system response regulator AtoC